MPRQRHLKSQTSWTLFVTGKEPLKDESFNTMKGSIHTLRWPFIIIFLFIVVGISLLYFISGHTYLQVILGYCFIGFSTFFLGYTGLILAQGIIKIITGGKLKEQRASSYYFTKKNKHRF